MDILCNTIGDIVKTHVDSSLGGLQMSTKRLLLLLAVVLILLQAGGLLLYYILKNETEVYSRELIIKVSWDDNENTSGESYSVIIPLPVREENNATLITSLDEINVVLGRCNLSFIEEEEFYGLKIQSDTEIFLRYNYKEKGENLDRERLIGRISSVSGDISTDSASINLFSNRTGLNAEVHFYQKISSSGGHGSSEFLKCCATLNEGWSRYPLKALTENEYYQL